MSEVDGELAARLEQALEDLGRLRDVLDEPPDLTRSSGLLEKALEVAGLRCTLGADIDETRDQLVLAARAGAAIFDPSAAAPGVPPDGPEPDTSVCDPWTLVRALYAGVIARAAAPTRLLAERGTPDSLTDQVFVAAELRRCALSLASLLRGGRVPVDDDHPGEPAPDPEEAEFWAAQAEGIEALARNDKEGWAEALAEAEQLFDDMYAEEPASDPNRGLRLPVHGLARLAEFAQGK